jgi:hypothetical protein
MKSKVTKFVNFGCWNYKCSSADSHIKKVMASVIEKDSEATFDFLIVNGDNYYQEKKSYDEIDQEGNPVTKEYKIVEKKNKTFKCN